MSLRRFNLWVRYRHYINSDFTLFTGVLIALIGPRCKFFYPGGAAFCITIVCVGFILVLWGFLYAHWGLKSVAVRDLSRLAYLNLVLHTLLLRYVYEEFLLEVLHLTLAALLYLIWRKVWRGGLPLKLGAPLPVRCWYARNLLLRVFAFTRFLGVWERGLLTSLIVLPGVWVVVVPEIWPLGFVELLLLFTQWRIGYSIVVRDPALLKCAQAGGLTFRLLPTLGQMLVVTFAYTVGQANCHDATLAWILSEVLRIEELSGYEYIWADAELRCRAQELLCPSTPLSSRALEWLHVSWKSGKDFWEAWLGQRPPKT